MSNPTTVIVTGVSSGIGRATAQRLAARGCRVFGTVRKPGQGEPIAGVEQIEMDVRDETSVQRAIDTVLAAAGRIDVLINNAGITMLGAVEETAPDEAAALFDTNVLGALRTARAVLPHMRSRGAGRMVNVSSVLGFLPAPYMGLYSASKHAIEGLSESLDHELRQFGIRVTLVQPSFTRTSLDINAPRARAPLAAYDRERDLATRAVAASVTGAPAPDAVADTIVAAALGPWRMRHAPTRDASLLRGLRRFMPAGPVDASLRKTFGLR